VLLWQVVVSGHEVAALTRLPGASSWVDSAQIEVQHCDLSNKALNLSGMGIDAVIHLAASRYGNSEDQRSSTIVDSVYIRFRNWSLDDSFH